MKGAKQRSAEDRFEALYIPEPNSGCWIWLAACDRDGYGFFSLSKPRRMVKAHRASFVFYRGAVPDGLCVLHSCDNPACVNPDHLFTGTNLDNVHDRVAKGRSARVHGSLRAHAKLHESDIPLIRIDHRSQQAIADDYGIAQTTVSAIKLRRKWAHVD